MTTRKKIIKGLIFNAEWWINKDLNLMDSEASNHIVDEYGIHRGALTLDDESWLCLFEAAYLRG